MRPTYQYDDTLNLKDAGLVASSAAATISGEAQIVDIGEGFVRGDVVIDVSAIEIASSTEYYRIYVEASSSATFASSIVPLGSIELGANEVIQGDTDSAIGRYILPITNERCGTVYRYLRIYTVVGGDVATGINFTAYLSKI